MKFLRKNKLALIAVSLLAVGAAGFAGFTYYKNNQQSPPAVVGPTEKEKKEALDSEASTEKTNTGEVKQATLNQSQHENQAATTAKADFSLVLVRAGQGDPGQPVETRAYVSGTAEGSCKITFSGPGSSFTKASEIIFDGRTTSCGALDASAAEFSSSGTWAYKLQATSGRRVSNVVEGKVAVQK